MRCRCAVDRRRCREAKSMASELQEIQKASFLLSSNILVPKLQFGNELVCEAPTSFSPEDLFADASSQNSWRGSRRFRDTRVTVLEPGNEDTTKVRIHRVCEAPPCKSSRAETWRLAESRDLVILREMRGDLVKSGKEPIRPKSHPLRFYMTYIV